jgi:AraC family transcriptional regulator
MCQCLPTGDFLGTIMRRRNCAGLSLTETRHPAGARLPPHCHERAYFCLIRRGTYREDFDGGRRYCGPHMLAFHPPREVHAESIDATDVCSFNIEFTAAWARGFANGPLPLERPFDCDAGPAVGLAVRLLDEFEHFDASSPLIVEGLMLELLGVCDRQVRDQQAGGQRLPPRWLRRIGDLLRERCADSWSLCELAATAGVHAGYLATAFRQHFGCTIGEYVRRQRIALACRSLAESDTPLADVALQAGFADQSHFTRTFKRQLGVTPAVYRKQESGPTKRSKS